MNPRLQVTIRKFTFFFVLFCILFSLVSAQDEIEAIQLKEVARFGNVESDENEVYTDFMLSPDENYIAVRSGDLIEVWNIDSRSLISKIETALGVFVWSPDSSKIATIVLDTELSIWDAFTGNLVDTYNGVDLKSNGVRAIQWHQPNLIATGSFEYLLWDLETGNSPQITNCHPWGSSLWWSPNGNYVATTGSESTVIWICDSQFEQVLSVEGYTTVSWNPDSSEIATVGIFNTLRVWSVTSGEALATSDGGENLIQDISWHSSGRRIVTGHLNDEVRLWERLTPDTFWLIGNAYIPELTDITWLGDQLITLSQTGMIQLWDMN